MVVRPERTYFLRSGPQYTQRTLRPELELDVFEVLQPITSLVSETGHLVSPDARHRLIERASRCLDFERFIKLCGGFLVKRQLVVGATLVRSAIFLGGLL